MNGETAEASIEVADFIKSLYTIATRSEEGTIIIDNHLTEVVNPNVFVESDYNAPTSYTDESLADYKEKRLRALEEILKGYTPSNPAIAPVVPGGQPVTNEPVIVPKLREGTWIQLNDGGKYQVMSIKGSNYVLATLDKVAYYEYPIEQIDSVLGVSVHLSTEPTKPVILPEGGKRPDLQQVLIEEAQASEEGVESDLEAQKKAQWYAKDDPGFKVYTFAGYRSGIGLEMSQGSVAVDADNNVNIINSGRKYKSTSGELVDETKSDLQALLDLDTFRNGSVKVPFNTYNTATTLLADVRSAVMFAKTNGAALSNVKKLVREFPPASKIASATTGELQVKYVNAFYQQTDQTVEMGDKTTPNRKLVVYTLKDRSGNPVAEFTIGVLPGEFTLDNWVQNYVGEDKNIRSKWQRLSKLLADGNEVAKNARRTVYIPLGTDFALGPNIISNTKISKVNELGQDIDKFGGNVRRTPFSEFKNAKSRIVSDVFIMTNVGVDNDFYDKSLSGKAVTFVTTKKDFTYKGIKALNDPNILAEAWMETRGNKDADKLDEVVKVVKLDPIGVNFEEYINGVSAFRRELANKTGNAKMFSPPGNKYTAARIFMNLLQFDLDLKTALVTGQTVHGVSIVEGDKFRYETGKVDIPSSRAIELISSLDSMMASAVNRIYGKNDAEKLATTNAEWGLTGEVSQVAIDKLNNAVLNRFDNYLENLKSYKDGEILAEFADSYSFTLAKLFHNYFAEFRTDSKNYSLRTDAKSQNLLRTVTRVLQNYEQSSFKEGIYYTPVYKGSAEGGGLATSMAYPAINMVNNFTVDVEAQTPDFVITGEALQRLANGIEQYMSSKPTLRPVEQNYTMDNAKAVLAAKAKFEYDEQFKGVFEMASDIVAKSIPTNKPALDKDIANSIYTTIKKMVADRKEGLVDSNTEGFILSVQGNLTPQGSMQLKFNTLGGVLRGLLNQPVTNISVDGSEGSALYSGKFEVNLQPYQWTMDSTGKVTYSEIQNPATDESQKAENLAKLEAETQKLEARKEKILNELVKGVSAPLVPKIKEGINILLSGDLGTKEYTRAKVLVAKAFSMAPSNLKSEWDSLLSDYANNKDAINNILGTCN